MGFRFQCCSQRGNPDCIFEITGCLEDCSNCKDYELRELEFDDDFSTALVRNESALELEDLFNV